MPRTREQILAKLDARDRELMLLPRCEGEADWVDFVIEVERCREIKASPKGEQPNLWKQWDIEDAYQSVNGFGAF